MTISYFALTLYLLVNEIHNSTYKHYTFTLDYERRFDQELFDISLDSGKLLADLRLDYFL